MTQNGPLEFAAQAVKHMPLRTRQLFQLHRQMGMMAGEMKVVPRQLAAQCLGCRAAPTIRTRMLTSRNVTVPVSEVLCGYAMVLRHKRYGLE